MPNFVFSAGSGGSGKDGVCIGEKRARTHEMCDVGGSDGEDSSLPGPPLPMSFKDKVSGLSGMAEDHLIIGDGDCVVMDGDIPSINFSESIKDCLYRPWRTSVIIKLMGRPLTYNFLRARLLHRWALKGPMSLIDLENNYFIVKFLLEEDMQYVLIGGPWQIAGQYLVTQQWKPGFNPKEERVTHMTAWVRVIGLNVEYFRPDVMGKIGNLIGHTVKVDALTMSQARGIKLVCFECGCYGHGRDNCPVILKAKAQAAEAEIAKDMEVNTPTKEDDLDAFSPEKVGDGSSSKLHGQWMLLQQKKFQKEQGSVSVKSTKASPQIEGGFKNAYSGSRFAVLDSDDTQRAVDEQVVNPFKYEVSKSIKHEATPASGSAKSGKRNTPAKDSKVWVFKKPLNDITNAKLEKNNIMGLKPGLGSKSAGKPRGGHTRGNLIVGAVGTQVRGLDVQDDVQGLFSFNVDAASLHADFRSVNVVLHDPEPPDIGQMELNEGEPHLVKASGSRKDEHDSVGNAVDLAGMSIDFDASDVEAEQVAL
ncbi:uncharacterized protein LOC117627015 [Prunus dulcis]|uniref:uncharacterized protein LOC117627015 n=1 Tax=Prunus dulcis TaxID=3755 RepID=UPI0014825025|nr:uncharacterized protein LOC117627015 [Prunus dulcis]